ncbi:hypothetical protein [Geminisphaera colitermitum]|uniref:hypothetical protein n=1 Tax=Geminisphaera colitermitum TaxID=1148786 RepID=UPI000158CFE2|nr:hypothetical protein [Geminisphaera colitermitum]
MSNTAAASSPSINNNYLASLHAKVDALTESLNAALSLAPTLPDDAIEARQARAAGHARGWFTAREFAAIIGRRHQFVTDRCKARVIHTLPGGCPYRIPLSEEERWNTDPNMRKGRHW